MRVLISSTPEQSHLAPQIPLALELQSRGHEVLVACSSKLGHYAQQIGIASVAAGLDLDPDRLGAGLDIMMRDRSEFAAWVVGEAVRVPVITTMFGQLPQPATDVEAAGDSLQELRRTQGLGLDPELSTLYAGPVLVPAPRSYVPNRRGVAYGVVRPADVA